MTNESWKNEYFKLSLLIVFLIWVAYANSLKVPFNFDDEVVIKNNEGIKKLEVYKNLYPIHYRHFFYLSFALNYAVGNLNPLGYHIVNIFSHCLSSLILWGIVFLTIKRGMFWDIKSAFSIASITTLIFALNPVHTEAITYISGRSSSLSALFFLASLLFFIFGNLKENSSAIRKFSFWFASYLMAGIALFTKETTGILIIIFPLYDLCFMKNEHWIPLKKRIWFYLPIPVAALFVINGSPELMQVAEEWKDKISLGYAFQQVNVILYAIKLTLFPFNLVFDYDFPNANYAKDAVRIVTYFFLGSGLMFLTYSIYKRFPWATFGLLWFLITISPTNSILPRMDLLSERNLYLPSIGLTFLFTIIFYQSLIVNRERSSIEKKLTLAVTVSIVLSFTFLTYHRNLDYQSNISLWEDAHKKSPLKARIYHNLSHFYTEQGKFDQAFVMLKKLAATNATPYYLSYAHTNLGNLYVRYGKMDLAEKEFKDALQYYPKLPTAHFNLGVLYASKAQYSLAKMFLEKAEIAQKNYKEAQILPPTLDLYLGNVYFQLSEFQPALDRIKNYEKAFPKSPDAHLLLGHIHSKMGNLKESINEYRLVSGLPTVEAESHQALGRIFKDQKKWNQAISEYEQANHKNPNHFETLFELGRLIWRFEGDISRSMGYLKEALKLSPSQDHWEKTNNLLGQIEKSS